MLGLWDPLAVLCLHTAGVGASASLRVSASAMSANAQGAEVPMVRGVIRGESVGSRPEPITRGVTV